MSTSYIYSIAHFSTISKKSISYSALMTPAEYKAQSQLANSPGMNPAVFNTKRTEFNMVKSYKAYDCMILKL